MKIIDIHTHVFPNEVASRALDTLSGTSGIKPFHRGTIEDLSESMQAAGISRSALMPVATRPEQVASINNWMASLDRSRFIPFGAVYPLGDDIESQIDTVCRLHFPGIKLHPDYQGFLPDDERLFPLYDLLQQRHLLLLMHCGRDPSFEDIKASPKRIKKISDLFPQLNLIAAHFGGFQVWDDVEKFLVGSPVYFDTSFAIINLGIERFRSMVISHGIDKIMFGTDSPWTDQRMEVETLKKCGFSSGELDKIFHKNAEQLLSNRG